MINILNISIVIYYNILIYNRNYYIIYYNAIYYNEKRVLV